MKDDIIKKALECCVVDDCVMCPLFEASELFSTCSYGLIKHTSDLINRQQVEIERLEKDFTKCNLEKEMLHQTVSEIQTEAINEFAERLRNCFCVSKEYLDIMNIIDNLVKEMTEVSE